MAPNQKERIVKTQRYLRKEKMNKMTLKCLRNASKNDNLGCKPFRT